MEQGAEKIKIQPGGNVGFGTTEHTYPLAAPSGRFVQNRVNLPCYNRADKSNMGYAQRYFTDRSDCASADGSWITDPLVQIYTGNIHCNYAHSFLTQWTYIPSEAGSPERAYEEIAPYILECGAQESLKAVRPLRNE